jgi:hypothetical protein
MASSVRREENNVNLEVAERVAVELRLMRKNIETLVELVEC